MTLPEAAGLLLAFLARLITGAQGHWYGCPPKAEQRIYFANHQSHFDWVLIWAALPRELRAATWPIAAREYWTASPVRQWLTRGRLLNTLRAMKMRIAGLDLDFTAENIAASRFVELVQVRHDGRFVR